MAQIPNRGLHHGRSMRPGKPGESDVVPTHELVLHPLVMDSIQLAVEEKYKAMTGTAPKCWRCGESQKLLPSKILIDQTSRYRDPPVYSISDYVWSEAGWGKITLAESGEGLLCPECSRDIAAQSGKLKDDEGEAV